MKTLVIFLVCLWTITSQATITVTDRGKGTNSTSQTTLVTTPTSTVAAGTMGVLLLAWDNSGTNGNTKIFTQSTFTDSVGNTWTLRLDEIYDPGAASAGVEIACYTAPIGTQITSSDSITVTGSTATSGKVANLWEVTSNAGTPTYVDSGATCSACTSGQTGTAATVTSSSIVSGNVVFGISGAERNNSATDTIDSDVTNGSWSARNNAGVTTPMQIITQYKVVTATGTQTYDVTLGGSADWQNGWVQIKESNGKFLQLFR